MIKIFPLWKSFVLHASKLLVDYTTGIQFIDIYIGSKVIEEKKCCSVHSVAAIHDFGFLSLYQSQEETCILGYNVKQNFGSSY